jgi:hypothetical protein
MCVCVCVCVCVCKYINIPYVLPHSIVHVFRSKLQKSSKRNNDNTNSLMEVFLRQSARSVCLFEAHLTTLFSVSDYIALNEGLIIE